MPETNTENTAGHVATSHPLFDGPIAYTAEVLPDDSDQATARTVEVMQRYIAEDANSNEVRAALRDAITPILQYSNAFGTAALIFQSIKRRVKFAPDPKTAAGTANLPAAPADIELLIRPRDLLRMTQPTGDCDDFSMLTAAMLAAAGIPYELVTIAADRQHPQEFSHVFVRAVLEDGSRVAMDTSHGTHIGWEYPSPTREQVWTQHQGTRTMNGLASTANFTDYFKSIGADTVLPTSPAPASTPNLTNTIVNRAFDFIQGRYGQAPAVRYSGNGVQYTQYQPQPLFSFSQPNIPGGPGIPGAGIPTWVLFAAAAAAVLMIARNNS
jgi:predicted transglutaminase-like cysteine proteinase